jgi:hypothetical protein
MTSALRNLLPLVLWVFLCSAGARAESIYIASPNSDIQAIKLETGAVRVVGSTFGARGLAVSPKGDVFYRWTDNFVYWVNPAGKLTGLGRTSQVTNLSFVPSANGGTLYGVNPGSRDISYWQITGNTYSANSFFTRIDAPSSIAATANNIFVAGGDPGLRTVYKDITPNSNNYTVLASSTAGFENITAIAVNSLGELYIADQGLDAIFKITTMGVLSLFLDSTDGIYNPMGLAFDSLNNLYISNAGTGSILKSTLSGEVSTFVSGLLNPAQIAIGGDFVAVPEPNTWMLLFSAVGFFFLRPRARIFTSPLRSTPSR